MSLSQLLGGACRDEVVTSYWAGLQNPEYSVAAAEKARDGRFSCMKIKVMHGMDVVGRLERMLEVAPDLNRENLRKLARKHEPGFRDPDRCAVGLDRRREPVARRQADSWTFVLVASNGV